MEVRGRGGGWGEKDLEIVTEQLVVRSKGVKRPVPPGPLGLPPIIPLLLSLWNSALKGAEFPAWEESAPGILLSL